MTLSSAMQALSAWSRDAVNVLTFNLTKNPTPVEPAPPIKRVPNWQHARTYASTHAKLRAETYGGEGRA